MTGILIIKGEETQAETQEEHHVMTKGEWSDISTNQEHRGWPANTGSPKGTRKYLSLDVSRRSWPCRHLHFKLLVSRTVRHISVVLSHPAYGDLLWQP